MSASASTNLPGRAKLLYEAYCGSDRTSSTPNPTAHRVTDGKPTSSGCSCTPNAYGCCISCAGPRPAARRGATRRSRRYDRPAFLKIAVRIEELNTRIKIALRSASDIATR